MGSIYLIRNNVNGKSYVGKTVRDAEKTPFFYMHLNGYGGAKLLARAIKKYGKENFSWEIIHDGILPNLLDSLPEIGDNSRNITLCLRTVIILQRVVRVLFLHRKHVEKYRRQTRGKKGIGKTRSVQ